MSYRLDRNRNSVKIIIYAREHIPTKILAKHNLPDIEGIFFERKIPCSQNDQYS